MPESPTEILRRFLHREPVLKVLAVGTALAAVAVFSYLGYVRPPQAHIWGDEGTYLAMTASLARDGDLSFEAADRDWAIERGNEKGVAVILQRAGDRITYSKPLLYPLVAALPYKVLGEPGLVLVNAFALAVGLFFVALHLGRLGHGGHLWLTVAVFASCGAVVPYVVWRMSEALQIGLAMSGMALALGALRPLERGGSPSDAKEGDDPRPPSTPRPPSRLLASPWAPWIGGALLGLLVSMRSSNAILVAGVVAACWLTADARQAGRVAGGAAAAIALTVLVSLVGLGTANPYLAERSSFNAAIGYPTAPSDEAAQRFDERPATHRTRVEVSKLTLWSAYYFVTGRHTGLLAYFPLALVLVYWLLRHRDRLGLTLLAAVVGSAAFYLVYMPQNYFGGATFIGNRYFLIAYPALVLGIRRLPPPTLLAATLILGLFTGGSAIASVRVTRGLDATSQSHTAAGIFGFLPYESTAREIEGQKGRFWSRDYVRFLDSFADVGRRRFVLRSDRPAAEIMIASRLPRKRLAFLVRVRGRGRAAFDWRDWTRTGWRPLQGTARRRQGLVVFRPATPWRSHPFAFQNDETYQVRVLSLAIHPVRSKAFPERRLVEAEVYYLDDVEILQSYPLKVQNQSLPRRGIAGGPGTVRLSLQNRSEVAWDPDGVLSVLAGVRIQPLDAEGDEADRPRVEGEVDEPNLPPARRGIERALSRPDVQRFDLPHVVPPNESVVLELSVRFPDEPGDYRLEVDLALHPVYWFLQHRGEPVASTRLEVVPRQPSATP